MPQEENQFDVPMISSPSKNLRGSKALVTNSDSSHSTEEVIHDHELAQRKAEEAGSRRYEAAEWLRQMDHGASALLPKEPSEEEFCLALRNGLILCNVLNKVNPGAVLKVVDNSVLAVQSNEGAAQSAIQFFENTRNFLEAVKDMKLLTFEASDLEKEGSSSKVVDCILCLKGYYQWKLSGGVGVWRYGGTVKITSFPRGYPSSTNSSENADEYLDELESSQFERLLEFVHLSSEVSFEESRTANTLAFLVDRFGLKLLQAYLREAIRTEEFPLNSMVIDAMIVKVLKNFSEHLVSQGTQLGVFLKKILKGDIGCLSKSEFIEAISLYLDKKSNLLSNDFSKLCICGEKLERVRVDDKLSAGQHQIIALQQQELEELKYSLEETRLQVKKTQLDWKHELGRLEHHIKSLEVASSSYHEVLEENRLLYNQVQDLKGTIRVYCRVRPFLPGSSSGQSTVDHIGDNGNIMIVNPLKHGKDARKIFSFNKVFETNVTQEQIYADTQPLVRSVLDGFNVCIFAYGQTGSGKTYTMSGPDLTNEETWGVNYRALRDLFHISKQRGDLIRYEVGVQMIEIYNEQVRDLLVSDGSNRRLDIRNSSQPNGLNVPDASLVPVTCTQDVLDLMRIGQKNRAVGATALNVRSSRSHSVLTVHVQGRELVSNSILRGCLHLVDLAGSERVDKSEAVGERLREAQHINRSLSALGDVISALAQKSTHIPYRNSKLTQVLQDSLGGHAKTLMFVHINPELNALWETISTLKFAERVAAIDLGAARSNKETGEIRELKEEITNLKMALERKESELERLKLNSSISTQKTRSISPFRMPRYGNGVNPSLKNETYQRPMDESKNSEARSSSSGKQRRVRFPSSLIDKEVIPNIPLIAEEKLPCNGNGKHRSPSPPVRRSLSTDRATIIRSKIKNDPIENQPAVRHLFPARVPVDKSISTVPMIQSSDINLRVHISLQETTNKDNVDDQISLHKVNSERVYPEHEGEQFKQALNVRHGGIRKSKTDKAKAKINQQLPVRNQKRDMVTHMLSDIYITAGDRTEESPRRSDFSESENDSGLADSTVLGALKAQTHQPSLSKNSQNLGLRQTMQVAKPFLSSKYENKHSDGLARDSKESSCNLSIPELRRSRSTPRGKFSLLS